MNNVKNIAVFLMLLFCTHLMANNSTTELVLGSHFKIVKPLCKNTKSTAEKELEDVGENPVNTASGFAVNCQINFLIEEQFSTDFQEEITKAENVYIPKINLSVALQKIGPPPKL